MHTGTLRKLALALTFWLALRFSPLHADQTITGNLTVTVNSDLQGNTLTFAMRTDNSNPGAQLLYTDGTTSSLEFDASRSANIWKWQQNGGATLKLQMSLSNANALVLFDQSSTPVAKITLNPLGTSIFANSVTLNGTDNEMPNQTLVNSHSVLTEGLADSRYLSSANIAIGSGTSPWHNAAGAFSFADGVGSTASGYCSTAMGYFSTASGLISSTAMGRSTASSSYSTAMGRSTASGSGSTAMGANSTASGQGSTAMGWYSTASGNYSTTSGKYSTASGYYSTAMGNQTTAQSFSSVALGQLNVGGGNPTSWVATDPLFEIGNGTASSYYFYPNTSSAWYAGIGGFGIPGTRSDAFVVYKNGSVAMGTAPIGGAGLLLEIGNGTPATEGGDVNGNIISTPAVASDAFAVYQNGNVAAQGTVTAPTFVTTAPAGDIPMYTGH